MIRQLSFLVGALCVIAAMSLFKLHLLDSQYAAVALSTDTATTAVDVSYPVTTGTAAITLFPVAGPVSHTPAAAASTPTPTVSTPSQTARLVPNITDSDALNTLVRSAVVNIECTAPNSEGPVSGSGVIIDPRGIILTNAHVAQYVFLAESGHVTLDCSIRTGSPAHDAYKAQVIYLSQQWVAAHANEIREESPQGTGENDYALLRITASITDTPLPNSFPFIAPNTGEDAQTTGQSVLVASYPAGFLSGASALYDLSMVSTITTLKQVFTFSDAYTPDLVSLGGIISAQGGSSGGAVADGLGHILAIIVTSSKGTQTDERDLRAVTLYHINQSMEKETGTSLSEYLSGNLGTIEKTFETTIAPALYQKFFDALTPATS